MGSLPLHPYFNSPPLPPHSSTPFSSSTNWSRHLALSDRIGRGLAVAPQLANQRRWGANNLWEFCTQKPRAASPYLRRPLAYNSVRHVSPQPHRPKPQPQKTEVEPKTHVQFQAKLNDNKRLAGLGAVEEREVVEVGKERKSGGPYAYAFGLYANKGNLKEQLREKYRNPSSEKWMESKEFYKDVVENDLHMTVKLKIVKELEINCLLTAFKESIGSRLQNFNGTQKEKEEILKRFTSKFNDHCNLRSGTTIDFVRDPSHILKIKIDDHHIDYIDDEDMSRAQRQLLCRCLFDLYIGEDPVDEKAKINIGSRLASWLKEY